MKIRITLDEALEAIKEQYIKKGFNIGEVDILLPKFVKNVGFELDIIEQKELDKPKKK